MAKQKNDPFTVSSQQWEIQNAADTLIKAEELRNKPALYKAAKAELNRRAQAIRAVTKGSKK